MFYQKFQKVGVVYVVVQNVMNGRKKEKPGLYMKE